MLASGKSDRCEGSRSRLTSAGCDRGRARDQAQARSGTVSRPISPGIEKRRRSSDRALRHSKSKQRRRVMDKPPSPSCSRSSLFLVGRNSRGNWVVRDQKGLCGGLFVDRAEAVKFAMFENGHRPQAVIMVPGILELDMSGKPGASDQADAQPALARAA